jgi:hypothetical protein
MTKRSTRLATHSVFAAAALVWFLAQEAPADSAIVSSPGVVADAVLDAPPTSSAADGLAVNSSDGARQCYGKGFGPDVRWTRGYRSRCA